ncbi:L,D-transpeptidase [Pseudanabaena sp. FACHB-2040]|uniref:L,D-transpeptidase n=1 Tax=Pseudanabaena sp. FACHB-2040 TaxID=2692859 RepID=UPI0016881481|nr:L,D-transpeptidase [Pseudanabaena sp. FACHB-2040]MBD0269207.1 L,D-transpeptidase [Cyanobacteria bacterium Co-bin8]MBD2257528.1 L,D-transpeptidase [Pseudanabaena sp. FACHB-2040]
MTSQSPIKRCFMALCYTAAGLLATGAWQGYLTGANVPNDSLFQSSGTLRLAFALEHIPTALTGRNQQIVIDLGQRRLELYREDEVILSYDVAIGQDDWQTPAGNFIVRDMRQNPAWLHPITQEPVGPGPDNPLGSRWIGFWTDGEHHIGLHGTNEEDLIGEAVSHGCVRMRESDIQALYTQISLGTPVLVKP